MVTKVYLLERNGRVPTDSSIQEMLKNVVDLAEKKTSIKTYSGAVFNNPNTLRKRLKPSSVLIHIRADSLHYDVIKGAPQIAEIKGKLRENPKISSWQIIEESLIKPTSN